MITIREIATTKDIDALLQLGRAHLAEVGSNLPFDPKWVTLNAEHVISHPRRYRNCWIAWVDEIPVGYGVGTCNPFFFNTELSANLSLYYVHPEYRGRWVFMRIIQTYQRWAKASDAAQAYIGVSMQYKDEAKRIERLFPRMGFEWSGTNYIKEMR